MPEMKGTLVVLVLRRGNRTCKDPKAGAQRGSLSVQRVRGVRRLTAHRLFIVMTVAPAPSDRMALEGVKERPSRLSVNSQ